LDWINAYTKDDLKASIERPNGTSKRVHAASGVGGISYKRDEILLY
jgi:hypothetical protein